MPDGNINMSGILPSCISDIRAGQVKLSGKILTLFNCKISIARFLEKPYFHLTRSGFTYCRQYNDTNISIIKANAKLIYKPPLTKAVVQSSNTLKPQLPLKAIRVRW
jgi:hypothetical protein